VRGELGTLLGREVALGVYFSFEALGDCGAHDDRVMTDDGQPGALARDLRPSGQSPMRREGSGVSIGCERGPRTAKYSNRRGRWPLPQTFTDGPTYANACWRGLMLSFPF
jgi:hypothetical protein